jgi:2-haloacid dehalogenase
VQRLRAAVFDVGQVLVHWDIRTLYAPLITDPVERDWFCANVVTPDWHFQHDAGRSVQATIPELAARFPQYRALIEVFGTRFQDTIGPDIAGMPALLTDLDATGLPLFAVTNFSIEFWPDFAARNLMMRHFRDVIVSGAHRLVKPDPAIYALALQRFRLEPDTAVFIDDRAENVAAATACGFIGIRFESAEKLRADLVAFGIML